MELLLAIALELFASEVWDRVKARFQSPDPTWADAVVQALEPTLGRALTKYEREAIVGWLTRPDVFSVLVGSTLDTLPQDVERVVNALEYELGPPSPERKELAAAIARTVVMHVTELVDPSVVATLAAHRSVKADMSDLKLGQAFIVDVINDGVAQILSQRSTLAVVGQVQTLALEAAVLERLPMAVVAELELARGAGADAATMVRWLEDRSRVASNLDVLVREPPRWLVSSGELWAAAAFAAEAYGRPDQTIAALEQAAALSPSRRSEFLARAAAVAAGDEDLAALSAELLERARIGATDTDLLLIAVVDAAIDEDAQRLEECAVRALDAGAPCAGIVRCWLGQAKARNGDLEAAVAVFDAGYDQLRSQAGLLLAYADVLLRWSLGQSSVDRIRGLQRTLAVAVEARDRRRAWGGDSSLATAIACQAAFSLEQFADVIIMGTPADDGATDNEADHPEVRQLVALARLIEGGETPESDRPFERAWFLGLSLSRDSASRAEAIAELEQAVHLADNEGELDRAQRSLAHIGHTGLPRLDEVRARDPEHAEILLAMAEMYSGQLAAAANRLRPLAGRNMLAALQLAETYRLQSKPDEAAGLLAQAGERFRDPRLLALAARQYLDLGQLERFAYCAELALPLAPSPSPVRRDIRWLQVEAAVKRQEPAAIDAATRTALDEGDEREALRWLRIEVLARLHHLKQAWSELRRAPALVPDTDARALLLLQVLIREEPTASQLMAEVLDAFPDAHDVHAAGISLFLGFVAPDDRDRAGVEAMQAHVARFIERYPDSPVLRSMDVSADDPEQLREQMRAMLNPDPERDRLIQHLAEQALLGKVPMGLAASMLGRTYLGVLLNGLAVGFTTVPAAAVLDEEVEIATAALEHPVVVDISTLVVMAFVPDLWPSILAAFSSVAIPTTTVAEVNDSVLAKKPAGFVRWDHQQDTMVFTPASGEQLDAITAQRDQIRAWISELQVVPAGDRSDLPGLRDLEDDSGTWCDSLTAASGRQSGLLCDDVALAAFARSVGVPAFGSFALMMALARGGQITEVQFAGVVTRLYEVQADDMPLSPVRLAAFALARDWSLLAAIHPMTRPAYWRDPQTAVSGIVATLEGFRDTPDAAARTLYAATVGVIRAVVAGSPLPIIGRLFAHAMLLVERKPSEVAELVAAMRAASEGRQLDDPLPAAVRAVLEATSTSLDAGEVAVFVTTAFSSLEQADRTIAASIVLE